MAVTACNKPVKVEATDNIPATYNATDSSMPEKITSIAETLIGTPYNYASCDVNSGFDCSGFVYYVFAHYGLEVPRSSIDFTDKGKEVPLQDARRGDIILFTGTNPAKRIVGHLSIITTAQADSISFIHSTSGKEYSVTVSPLDEHYTQRFMKVIRVFDERREFRL